MMQKGQNHNHPKKGSRIEVEPLRKEKNIKAIIQLLSGQPRNQLFFIMGINNGLRAGDLLNIKVGDVRYLKTGQAHQIIERKTGKKNILVINKVIQKALNHYFAIEGQSEDHHFLFRSRPWADKKMDTGHKFKGEFWNAYAPQNMGLSAKGKVWGGV